MPEKTSVPISMLVPSNYRDHGDISEFVASVAKQGILQPLLVTALSDGRFKVKEGHKRLKAAGIVGLQEVPITVVKEASDPKERLLQQLVINNLQQRDGVLLALKLKELKDQGFTNNRLAEAMGKTEAWVSKTTGLVLEDNAPYMAFITGKPLWFLKKDDKFFLTVEDIGKAGENEAEYKMLEGVGEEVPSIYYCDELVRIYKNDLSPEDPEHLNIFNRYVAALIDAKRNKKEDISHACGLILKKITQQAQSGVGAEKPALDPDRAAESIARIFLRGKIEDPKELQKKCRSLFKKLEIPYRIYIEERDLKSSETTAE